jgi:uncharacterized protein YerC
MNIKDGRPTVHPLVVDNIVKLLKEGKTQQIIAETCGVSQAYVSKVKKRQHETH